MNYVYTTLVMLIAVWTYAGESSSSTWVSDDDARNSTSDSTSERDLIQHLRELGKLDGNLINARPVRNYSHAVPVKMSVQLIQLMDIDEKKQVLTLNVWPAFRWVDEYIRWDPASYGGVDELRLPVDSIWSPDIALYNSVEPTANQNRGICIVTYHGNVTYVPHRIYKSACSFRTYAADPLREQYCTLKFGSWTYDGLKLDLDFDGPAEMIMFDFNPGLDWSVLSTDAVRNLIKYACCPDTYYIDLTYTIRFKRPAAYLQRLVPTYVK